MPLLKTLSINCSAGSYTSVFLRAPDVLTLQPVFPNLNELEWNQEGSDLDWMAGNLDGIEQFSSVQTFRNRIRVVPSEQPIKERDMLKDIVIATKLKFKASEGGDRTVETNILVNKADWKEEAVYEQETGLANGMWLLVSVSLSPSHMFDQYRGKGQLTYSTRSFLNRIIAYFCFLSLRHCMPQL